MQKRQDNKQNKMKKRENPAISNLKKGEDLKKNKMRKKRKGTKAKDQDEGQVQNI